MAMKTRRVRVAVAVLACVAALWLLAGCQRLNMSALVKGAYGVWDEAIFGTSIYGP
jgi:hypothetical protein